MKKLLFLFSVSFFLIYASDDFLKDAELIHIEAQYIGGGTYFPEYGYNKFYCVNTPNSEIKKYEEIQKYMAYAKRIEKTDEELTKKVNFMQSFYERIMCGFGGSISDIEKLQRAQYKNEILEIEASGGGITIDQESSENNMKTLYTKNAFNCVIVGCFDITEKTRALWHINFIQGRPTQLLNRLDAYLKNTSEELITVLFSGYYSSNVLDVANIIKNNNCSIDYADIFPLYKCDKLKEKEDIFLYVGDPNFSVQKDLKNTEIPCVFNGMPYQRKSLAITPDGEFVIPILPKKCGPEIKQIKYLKDMYHQSLYDEIGGVENNNSQIVKEEEKQKGDNHESSITADKIISSEGGNLNNSNQIKQQENRVTLARLFFIHFYYFLLKQTKN